MYEDNLVAEHFFHLVDDVVEINLVAIELVDGENNWFLDFFRDAENILTTDFNTILCVDEQHARVGHVESRDGASHEVVASRAVNHVEFLVEKLGIAHC